MRGSVDKILFSCKLIIDCGGESNEEGQVMKTEKIDQNFWSAAEKVFHDHPTVKVKDRMSLKRMFLTELFNIERGKSALNQELQKIVIDICDRFLGHKVKPTLKGGNHECV